MLFNIFFYFITLKVLQELNTILDETPVVESFTMDFESGIMNNYLN